jgi:hypothetical protein
MISGRMGSELDAKEIDREHIAPINRLSRLLMHQLVTDIQEEFVILHGISDLSVFHLFRTFACC